MLTNLQDLTNIANMAMGSKKEILEVSLDEIKSKPQVRKKFENLDELATSLIAEGQQSPIIVSPKGSDGKYTIQKGERRWRALKLAGLETASILVVEKPQTRVNEIAGELIENIQRDDLTAMEIAQAIEELFNEGLSRKDIAKRIGKSDTYVSTMLSISNSPSVVKKIYEDGVVQQPDILYSLTRMYELDSNLTKEVCELARTEGISRQKARDFLSQAREQSTNKPESKSNNLGESTDEISVVQQDANSGFKSKNKQNAVLIYVKFIDENFSSQTGVVDLSCIDEQGTKLWITLTNGDRVTKKANDIEIIKIEKA